MEDGVFGTACSAHDTRPDECNSILVLNPSPDETVLPYVTCAVCKHCISGKLQLEV